MTDRTQSAAQRTRGESSPIFGGFEPITANFLYCPNQFFDVCLPNSSRGVVRLVSYMLRRTLGWLDDNGNPIEQHLRLSYRDLIANAGISRGMLHQVIEEAVAANFIACLRPGRAYKSGVTAQTAEYVLRWGDGVGDYVTDPTLFNGFFAGEGNRTPIPNAFFDHVIPCEPLAVIKVVGAVLRHTVGYQNQFGGRRCDAPLSYTYLHSYTKIGSTRTLSTAIHNALNAGYIRRVRDGCFHPDRDERHPASYAVQWLSQASSSPNGSKRNVAEQSEKESSGVVQKGKHDQFEKQRSNGSKSKAEERSEKESIGKTSANDTSKQQHADTADTDAKGYQMLIEQGIDRATAWQLSATHAPEHIAQQIVWLPYRQPTKNPQGMLRKAIEDDWPEPAAAKTATDKQRARNRCQRRRVQDAETKQANDALEHREHERHATQLAAWKNLTPELQKRYYDRAIAQTESPSTAALLRRRRHSDTPPLHVLSLMAREQPALIGE